MTDNLAACKTPGRCGQCLAQERERRSRAIQAAKPAEKGRRIGYPVGIEDGGRCGFQRAVFHKVEPQCLTASQQAVVCVGERKRRQEGEGGATTITNAAPDLNPVMMLIMSLLAPTAVANDRVAITNRASSQYDGGPFCGPGSFRVALPIGKWDKENRSNGDSARVTTCPDLKPKAESSPPSKKSQLEKNTAFPLATICAEVQRIGRSTATCMRRRTPQ